VSHGEDLPSGAHSPAYAPPTIVIAAANIINFFMSTPLLFLFLLPPRDS